MRDHASDEGLEPIPIFGNGDAYDYREYYDKMESSGVDGIMIARGALIKVSTTARVPCEEAMWLMGTIRDSRGSSQKSRNDEIVRLLRCDSPDLIKL